MKRNSIGYGRVVTHDLYDIADRLKEIDEDYFVFIPIGISGMRFITRGKGAIRLLWRSRMTNWTNVL